MCREHSDTLTGTGRGAAREVTGSPYYRQRHAEVTATPSDDALAGLDARFSVSSPQRSAHLRARAAQEADRRKEPGQRLRIPVLAGRRDHGFVRDRVATGSPGMPNFCFKSRSATDPNAGGRAPAAHR